MVLDPFFGTGTTGAVARRLGRHFIGIEREQAYIDAAQARIDAVEPLDSNNLTLVTGKRAQPRVAFIALIEAGLLAPGAVLTDAKRRWTATVQADGSLARDGEQASIHRMGARVQGFDACNGWTFWHVEAQGALKPIDALRQTVRDRMAAAGG